MSQYILYLPPHNARGRERQRERDKINRGTYRVYKNGMPYTCIRIPSIPIPEPRPYQFVSGIQCPRFNPQRQLHEINHVHQRRRCKRTSDWSFVEGKIKDPASKNERPNNSYFAPNLMPHSKLKLLTIEIPLLLRLRLRLLVLLCR